VNQTAFQGTPNRQHLEVSRELMIQLIESSSQWDGFRHYSQPQNPADSSKSQDRVFYGGTTKEEIKDPSNHRIGLQHWSLEGIAGSYLQYLFFSFYQVLPMLDLSHLC
jgi:hypothetical protein